MISKNKLKALSAYKAQRQCDLDNVFVVEGDKMCREALASGWNVRTICATPSWLESHRPQLAGIECCEVSQTELERLSALRTPNEVWALLDRKAIATPDYQGLTLALDHLQDPGNLGTIIRTADWFGIRKIVCSPNTVSCYNPKVVQSTMGGIFRTSIEYKELVPFLQEAKNRNTPVYGALLNGKDVYHAEVTQRGILVIGNESKGISPEVAEEVTLRLTIPNIGQTCESLNAAVATAILCSEIISRSRK